jgi:hypothetical protein
VPWCGAKHAGEIIETYAVHANPPARGGPDSRRGASGCLVWTRCPPRPRRYRDGPPR